MRDCINQLWLWNFLWTDLGWFSYQLEFQIWFDPQLLAWEQALRGTLAVGWEKEGESQEFEFHLQFPCGSPETELSDFCQSARSRIERECQQTLKKHVPRVMASLLMSSPPISISHRLFWFGYSNSRDVVASSSSLSRPAARAPRRACLQATQLHDLQPSCS